MRVTLRTPKPQPGGLIDISRVVDSRRPPGSISNRPAPGTGARTIRLTQSHTKYFGSYSTPFLSSRPLIERAGPAPYSAVCPVCSFKNAFSNSGCSAGPPVNAITPFNAWLLFISPPVAR
jgi:hypothetical protein